MQNADKVPVGGRIRFLHSEFCILKYAQASFHQKSSCTPTFANLAGMTSVGVSHVGPYVEFEF